MDTNPKKSGNTRRLLAIMFTDIKGYTDMMGADEQATVEKVLEHREIVRATLAEHDGHEHETIGDAFVVLFESVVNAVKCAIAIQERHAVRNEGKPESDQIWMRIGVHLGDIILREGGIYGDAVNMAARVEGRAQPGGVCITEQVKLQIKGRIDVGMASMGTLPLKGIRHPPELFRLLLPSARGEVPALAVTDSAAAGRKLVLAAAVLVLAVGTAFAINAARGTADEHKARPAPALQNPPSAHPAVKTAAAPAPKAAPAQPTKAQQKEHEIAEAARSMAQDKVAEAMALTGKRKVQVLSEAATLDPESAAIARMLKLAKEQLAAHPEPAPRAADTHTRRASRRAVGGRAHKASAERAGAGLDPLAGERTIKPHVVAD